MYVQSVLSINNGWSILNAQKATEKKEIFTSLKQLSEKIPIELRSNSGSKFMFSNYNEGLYLDLFTNYKDILKDSFLWDSYLHVSPRQTSDYHTRIPVKNRVLSSLAAVTEEMGGDFMTSLFINIPHWYREGLTEVSVLFIPSTSTPAYVRSVSENFRISEEKYRHEVAKYRELLSPAPVVLAFFSSTKPSKIRIKEYASLKVSSQAVERIIEFAPEYYLAGVGLLTYFGEILRQKDPKTKAKVRIEQEGNRVRLHIESPTGDIEIIEKELEQYALVISNQAPPESLLDNPVQLLQLKSQLRMAQVQVELAHDLKQITDGRITSLENQLEFFQNQFAAQVLRTDKIIDLVGRQNDSQERMQAALLTHSEKLFSKLLKEARGNQQLLEAVNSLHQNLLAGITTIEMEDQLERALSTIKEAKPGLIGRISKELEGAAYKTTASSALSWVTKWIATHVQ